MRTRLINHEVMELLYRLGIHNWKLSEPEKAYLHRFVFLSIQRGMETLGIPIEEQDPLLPTEMIRPPLFDRVPPMPRVTHVDEILGQVTEVVKTNGRHI
jgi:hypothetical protein